MQKPGTVIGQRYELEELLGKSNMGFIYAAKHRVLGKRVSVKILRPELCNSSDKVRRLLNEAQKLSQIRHENIADISDFGRDTSGILYLVREHLTGHSLAELLAREGKLSLNRAMSILRQICRALDCVNKAQVTHGNLTPHNIFLTTESGREDFVKLLDIGFTQALSNKHRPATTGDAMETTAYLAPEQLAGASAKNTDRSVDMYALGVIIHEILTGQLPFKSMTQSELVVEKLGGATNDLTHSAIASEAPAIARLVQESLEIDGGRRPSSASEVEQRLFSSGGAFSEQPDDLAGVRVGSYRLVQLLGTGGLGSVWLGEHPVIGSKVAIKILHSEMCDSSEAVRRFVVEAQAVNRVNNPHIVKTFDFGKLSDGRDFAVMELLEGETLAERLDRSGPMTWEQARQVTLQLLQALSAAHDAGIIHRDLKPENIHLGGDPEEPKVKVLDFGIAKLMDTEIAPRQRTKQGFCIGTPLYAAPEQMAGDDVGPGADMYALAIVLFEILVGQPPFIGSLKEVVHDKMNLAPPSFCTLIPDLPDGITRLLDSMFSMDAGARPSASDAFTTLESMPAPSSGASFAVLSQSCLSVEQRAELSDCDTLPPPARQTIPLKKPLRLPASTRRSSTGDAPESAPANIAAPATPSEPDTADDEQAEIKRNFMEIVNGDADLQLRPQDDDSDNEVTRVHRSLARRLMEETEAITVPRRNQAGKLIAAAVVVIVIGGLSYLGLHLIDPVSSGSHPVVQSVKPPLAAAEAPAEARRTGKEIVLASRTQNESAAIGGVNTAPAAEHARQPHFLNSVPQGAAVWLGGRHLGVTPLRRVISERALPMTVTLRKSGYRVRRWILRKEHGRSLRLSLKPLETRDSPGSERADTSQASAPRAEAPAATESKPGAASTAPGEAPGITAASPTPPAPDTTDGATVAPAAPSAAPARTMPVKIPGAKTIVDPFED